MPRLYVVPYNLGSESAKKLAQGLGCLRSNGGKKFRWDTTVINWGNSQVNLRGHRIKVLNKPEAIAIASNKLSTFRTLQMYGVPTVEWTTDRVKASDWLDENTIVYARHKLSSSSGDGIEIVKFEDNIPYAPLYTKGFNKSHEYRVHIANGRVIDFTKKKHRSGVETNPLIKNMANGWVFCRDGVALPGAVRAASLAAVQAIGLDFGAVDILYREREDVARILEINTAPGLEGTTLEKYKEELRKMVGLVPAWR